MNLSETNENTATGTASNDSPVSDTATPSESAVNQNVTTTEDAAATPAPPQNVNACRRQLSIEIPSEVVVQETNAVVANVQRTARIPGFRKGRVPATIVRQKYAEDIRKEVVETLFPRYLREEADRHHLIPVSQPRIANMHFHEGEPVTFQAFFEVMPDIDISGYKEIAPEKPAIVVTDEEVDQAVNNIREQQAAYTNVDEDRPLQDGDFAQVGFKGSSSKEDTEPAEINEVMVEIGGAVTIKEFTDNLRGAKPGDIREFDVVYPADFPDQRLASQSIHYAVTVNGIKNKSLPELNDDFVKQLGENMETIDDLKSRIRAGMTAEKEHQAEHEGKGKLLDTLINKFNFDVPDSFVEQQINIRLERGLRALSAQGMREEDMKKMDFPKLREGQRNAARGEVQATLLLGKIAEVEQIETTDEELDREIGTIALQAKQSVEAVRARLTHDGALDRIRDRIRTDKALEFLYNRS